MLADVKKGSFGSLFCLLPKRDSLDSSVKTSAKQQQYPLHALNHIKRLKNRLLRYPLD
ncbi:hypothetical protein VCHA56P521_170079 [Vibrio chagasii]|nr:hypothetical protein VCHA36P166_160075 [Vibrio chagasii]CAH6947118.1 hypothetical protein VCHA50P417_130080 [Vibrio chagasii]CAH6990996.1 hypothetical protein VCHA48P442_130079 [Vibrio chagasii]CAH7003751.1 hypothetical protein VCHA49P381_130103 [Vibrio chagasii]CAH7004253.1 hypothetical protein VCHA43P282_160041 [Vibrio chagasii]